MPYSKLRSALLILFILCNDPVTAQDINVMSFNIRLNLASDSMNAWPNRKDKVASQILFHKADLLGVQEALQIQMEDLKSMLHEYEAAGGGREDGKNKGEYSAVFYKKSRFKMLQQATFWLSPEPSVPGNKGWDAALPRIVTWVKLKDTRTKKILYFFNTHFDHMGIVARKESAKLLLRAVDSIAGKAPAIITGDFNAKPSEEPVRILKDKLNPLHFTDTREISATPHYGPEGSFNGFGPKEIHDEPIDFIFIKGSLKVLEHANISQTWNGRFASDHFAVLAKILL